jgi:hypothetical protein
MSGEGVLAGLRVVDFSNVLTGAQISQFFADYGADVVHIEPPAGSPLRAQAAWPFWGRGKRSVRLDLKSPKATWSSRPFVPGRWSALGSGTMRLPPKRLVSSMLRFRGSAAMAP